MLIQKYLQERGLTQARFAAILGCSTAFVNGLINGKNTDIKISLLRKLHSATAIPEDRLITELLSFKSKVEKKNAHGRKRSRA